MSDDLITASADAYFLGEGPLWDPVRSRLLWVDIRAGQVFTGALETTGDISSVERVDLGTAVGTVGAVGVSASGDWIVAGAERVYVRSPEGVLTPGPRLLEEGSGRRLNDGKADPAGRYLVGTLSLAGSSRTEVLASIDTDGSVRTIDADLTLSNGLAWTADSRTLYSVDTARRTVFRRTYDPGTGETGGRTVFLTIGDGFPDGMTIDAEDYLWIAVWGLGQVQRYTPEGDLDRVIHVPAPHTSSVVFAGPELDTLVITTARQDLSDDQLESHPLSGRIFTTKPGVSGRPEPLWGGLAASATLSATHE